MKPTEGLATPVPEATAPVARGRIDKTIPDPDANAFSVSFDDPNMAPVKATRAADPVPETVDVLSVVPLRIGKMIDGVSVASATAAVVLAAVVMTIGVVMWGADVV